MISVENISKRYPTKTAIEGMSFQVEKGEILGFLGPNGAGKTTTMRIIAGYMPASDGNVRVDGFDVFEKPLDVRRRIGYLPENPPLYVEMTVTSYLRFVSKIKGVVQGAVKIIARLTYRQRYQQSSGRDPLLCPHCHHEMGLWKIWHPKYGVVYDELDAIKRGKYGSSPA